MEFPDEQMVLLLKPSLADGNCKWAQTPVSHHNWPQTEACLLMREIIPLILKADKVHNTTVSLTFHLNIVVDTLYIHVEILVFMLLIQKKCLGQKQASKQTNK